MLRAVKAGRRVTSFATSVEVKSSNEEHRSPLRHFQCSAQSQKIINLCPGTCLRVWQDHFTYVSKKSPGQIDERQSSRVAHVPVNDWDARFPSQPNPTFGRRVTEWQ